MAVAFGLSACQTMRDTVGWVVHAPVHSADYDASKIPPAYCYRTRGGSDCYSEPQKGQENRLIHSQQPRMSKPEDEEAAATPSTTTRAAASPAAASPAAATPAAATKSPAAESGIPSPEPAPNPTSAPAATVQSSTAPSPAP